MLVRDLDGVDGNSSKFEVRRRAWRVLDCSLRRNWSGAHTDEVSVEGNGKRSVEELLVQLISEQEKTRQELGDKLDQTNAKLAQTNARLDQTNARLDQTNARLDQTNARLDQTREELLASDARTREDLGGRIDGVRLEVVALRAVARADDQELRDRVERIEKYLGLQPAR